MLIGSVGLSDHGSIVNRGRHRNAGSQGVAHHDPAVAMDGDPIVSTPVLEAVSHSLPNPTRAGFRGRDAKFEIVFPAGVAFIPIELVIRVLAPRCP